MNKDLRKGFVAALGGGAVAIAAALLSGKAGLEGREHYPYKDVVGVVTVCDGHTGPDIIWGRRYSDAECDALTQRDIRRIANQIDPAIKVKLTETQRASLYSFAYNVGPNAFKSSTLLKKLNQGDYLGACEQLKRWTYAGGQKWKGLVNRRDVEYEVCTWSQVNV